MNARAVAILSFLMKCESINLREIHLTLKTPFETSFGVTSKRRIILIEVASEGVSGWGEVSCTEGPYYNSECVDAAWVVLRDFIVPAIRGRNVERANVIPAMLAPIRGHEMAKAAVECAFWDLEGQQRGMPLHQLLGGTQTEISCGVSLGISPTPEHLLEKVETALASGYQRIKLKIKPGKDHAMVKAVRESHPEILLSVDANSAYRQTDIGMLKQLDEFNLLMIEQPLEWNEIYQHAKLQAQLKTSICLDECIRNVRDASAAIALKACRILNIKLGRVGGHTEAQQVQKICRDNEIPAWCGGMLESGIGRAHNIAMSTLPGFTLPGDISASSRYWDEDIIEPEVFVSSTGTIRPPLGQGIGFSVRKNRVESLTARREEIWE
jgi:O-succinylbenzoate synthase